MPNSQFVKIVNGQPTINPGDLRHPVTIWTTAVSSPPQFDAAGPVMSPSVFTTAMAAIDAVRGTDVIAGGQTATELYLTMVIWWQPGLLPNMTVVNNTTGSQYIIQSIENCLEMNVVLTLNLLGLGANQ